MKTLATSNGHEYNYDTQRYDNYIHQYRNVHVYIYSPVQIVPKSHFAALLNVHKLQYIHRIRAPSVQ